MAQVFVTPLTNGLNASRLTGGLVMAWILIRTFLITPLMLIMAVLILFVLVLQALCCEVRPSVEHNSNV